MNHPQNSLLSTKYVQGKGLGQVHLKLQYIPLTLGNPNVGEYGAIFIRAKKGRDFPSMDGDTVTPYITGKVHHNKQTGTARFGTHVRLSPPSLSVTVFSNSVGGIVVRDNSWRYSC